MASHGHDANGYAVTYNEARQRWELTDPNIATIVCPHCGKERTVEGYDGCLGYIPGAQNACCGHGTSPGYVHWNDGTRDVLPMKGPMDRFKLIEHHGGMVWTRTALEGLYRMHCLCVDCAKLAQDNCEGNCLIANALYALCVDHNIVAPVWECPDFERLT